MSLRRPNKTLEWQDLREPQVAQQRRALTQFLLREFTLRAVPVAVNGVLRRRWYVRRLKMWEYARGLTALPPRPGAPVLDFGGGGTLPPFYLAASGTPVHVLDINQRLANYSAEVAGKRNWPIEVDTFDLAAADAALPTRWREHFDRVYSYCVMEHIEMEGQERVLAHLADAVRPGGGMVLTFEFGENAPAEQPWRDLERVQRMVSILSDRGLQLQLGTDATQASAAFEDCGDRYVLDKRHPNAKFAFAMLVLEKPSGTA